MLDVENEAGLVFVVCTVGVYVMEIWTCWSVLHGFKQARGSFIGYNLSSIISFCLLIALFAGGMVPILRIPMDCNNTLAWYGITWAISQFCFVRLISLLSEKNSLKKSPE